MYRKAAIPLRVRRDVALRYGCPPGGEVDVPCHYCAKPGKIRWFTRRDGHPSAWVWFGHELDHHLAESVGGPTTVENLVLACQSCNRHKSSKAVAA